MPSIFCEFTVSFCLLLYNRKNTLTDFMGTSKYNEETVELLLQHLSNGENIQVACEKVGITKNTYSNWLKSKKGFKARTKEAFKAFRRSAPVNIKMHARQRIVDLILHGHVIRGKKITTTEKPVRDENGKIQEWRAISRLVEETETNMGTPEYALDRVLPIVPGLEEAFRIIKSHGYSIVIDPAHTEEHEQLLQLQSELSGEQNAAGTLTQDEYNAIRANILGVQDDASDTIEVSARVDNG